MSTLLFNRIFRVKTANNWQKFEKKRGGGQRQFREQWRDVAESARAAIKLESMHSQINFPAGRLHGIKG